MKVRLLIAMLLLVGMCANVKGEDKKVVKDGLVYRIYYDYEEGNSNQMYVSGPEDRTKLTKAVIASEVEYKGRIYPVTLIGYHAFYNCTNLTSITIPDGVMMIMRFKSFEGCTALTDIHCLATKPPVNMDYDFETSFDCTHYIGSVLHVPVGCVPVYRKANDWGYFIYIVEEGRENNLKQVTKNNMAYVIDPATHCATVLGPKDKATLTEAVIASSLEYEEQTYWVTKIGVRAFYNCMSLNSVTIPTEVTEIGLEAFCSCSSLTSLNVPDGVTMIGPCAFWGCSSLTSMNIPTGVTEIGFGTFTYCLSLTSITIPTGVTEIDDGAFRSCSSLTSIHLPIGMTKIGTSAFSACTNLISITIPTGVTEIGDGAFRSCSSLTSIHLPIGMTKIGASAFSACTNLISITIPTGVTEIGSEAFFGCTALTDIYCLAIEPPVNKYDEFPFDEATYARTTLHVLSGCAPAYQVAKEWKNFSHIVEDATAITATSATEPRILGATLYTLDGKKVRTLTAEEAQAADRLTAPQRGIYLLVTQTDRGVETRKLIK